MLTADLTVTSTGSKTSPGTASALTFALINPSSTANQTQRRVAATANTTPKTASIGHQLSGKGFNARCRSRVGFTYTDLTADPVVTGGVVPFAQGYFVLDRPLQSGGAITDAILGDLAGNVIDVLCASGQFAKLLNQEA